MVFDGRDLVDVDESAPYARKPIDYYTETKASMCSRLSMHTFLMLCAWVAEPETCCCLLDCFHKNLLTMLYTYLPAPSALLICRHG